jgi:hypothetical protein
MKFVCRPLCVLATVSLFALAVAPHAVAENLTPGDLFEPVTDEVEVAAPPVYQGPAPIEPAPQSPRKPTQAADPYAPQGLRLGSITVFPTLEMGVAATSNAGGKTSNAKADAGLLLKPGLEVESDWSRHQFSASVSGEVVRYLSVDELSTYGADAQAKLRLDVRHGTQLEIENGYTLTSTGSASSEVPDTAVGNRLSHLLRAGVAVNHEAGVADLRLGTALRQEFFEDVKLSGGGSEDNSDRDFTEYGVSLRGTFNRGAVFRPFAEVAFTPRVHDKRIDRSGLQRDSKGYSGTLGLRIDDDPVWSGEVGLTYLVRDYEDASLDTEHAPGVLTNLQWRPTELTQVDLSATMDIAETSSAADGGRAIWSTSAKVTHALRDNLDLLGGTSFSTAKSGTGRENTYGAEAGLEWKFNPMISWSLLYEGTWQDSPGGSDDYNEQRVLAGIILKR